MSEFQNLGSYLKQKRVDNGYTQAGLASSLGNLHSQFVSNWERGLCAPPGHSLQKLIDVLKLNREKLVDAMLEDARTEIEGRVFKKKTKATRR